MRWWLLLSFAACAEPKDPAYNRGGIGITPDQRLVYFSEYAMQFGTETIGMPTKLIGNDINLLAPPSDCVESLAGVGFYPAAMAVGDQPGGMTSSWEVLLKGPSVGRVKLSYSLPYSCNAGTQDTLSATSTFTFFPSGRVIRTDENVTASQQAFTDSSGCTKACSPGDHFFLSSFWAFLPGDVVDALGTNRNLIDEPGCIITNGHTIAIKYAGTNSRIENTTFNSSVGIHYFAADQVSWPATLAPQAMTSQLAIAPGNNPASCKDLIDVLSDPPLAVNGELVQPEDGIYQATKAYSGPIKVTSPTSIPQGFALKVNLGGAQHLRVRYNDQESTYFVAEADSDFPILFFPGGLMTNYTITLEPFD